MRWLLLALSLWAVPASAQPLQTLGVQENLTLGDTPYTFSVPAPPNTAKVRVVFVPDDAQPWKANVSLMSVSGEIRSGCSSDYTNMGNRYEMACSPQWGFFGKREGFPERMADRPGGAQLTVTLTRVSGTPTGTLTMSVERKAAPRVQFSSSVAFDAETAVTETSGGGGDGTINITHTASGSDRAAFCSAGSPNNKTSDSCTYAGNSMTEEWEVVQASAYMNAGYSIAGDANVPASSETVTSVISTCVCAAHYANVITMTGVDSGTPVGTAVTRTSFTTTHSVEVTDEGSDDLVVDSVTAGTPDTLTVGADQTEVTTEAAASAQLLSSYQDGVDGGVMSWTTVSSRSSAQGAIAFLAASGAASPPTRSLLGVGR